MENSKQLAPDWTKLGLNPITGFIAKKTTDADYSKKTYKKSKEKICTT